MAAAQSRSRRLSEGGPLDSRQARYLDIVIMKKRKSGF